MDTNMLKNKSFNTKTFKKNYLFNNKDLFYLIFPLIIEQILVASVGIIDTMMVSNVGEEAISGVGLVDMINFFIITVMVAIASGGSIIISQYIGDKNRRRAVFSASQLVMISFIISTLLAILFAVFHRFLLRLFFGKIEFGVMQAATIYFLISSISYPFLGIYNSSVAIYRSMRKTFITMRISLLMNIINIVGNYIGIFIFRAGVIGVAIPTLIARAVGAILIFSMIFNIKNKVFITWNHIFEWNRLIIKRILKIAIPNGIENGFFQLGKILVISIISLFGTQQIAASTVANSVDLFVILGVHAMNVASITVIGQCVGAKEYNQVYYYTKKLLIIAHSITFVIFLMFALNINSILSLYSIPKETKKLAVILILMHNSMAVLLHPEAFTLGNILRATGDVKYTMYVGAISMFITRVGMAYVLGYIFDFKVIGVWIAMILDWAIREIFFIMRFRSGKWKEFRAI